MDRSNLMAGTDGAPFRGSTHSYRWSYIRAVFLMRGLGNQPMARRIIRTFLSANTILMFGFAASAIVAVLLWALLEFVA